MGDELPRDETANDGYPPSFDTTPAPRSIDMASFETVSRDGQEVPLAPIDVAYNWYARGEARFADARGTGQYEESHVYGAVSSPALSDVDPDPVLSWPTEDRIICYCGCPHHLSSIRAADLLADGYERVAVIDEGFWEWVDRGYPLAGSDVESRPAQQVIAGRVPARYGGETAVARHRPSSQVEATQIGNDGRFRLELRFAGVSLQDPITVETPAFRRTAPLATLTAGILTG